MLYNSFIDEFSFIDKNIVLDLKKTAVLQINKSNANLIIKLLNIYCYLYDVRLNYLTFKNSSNKQLFSSFYNFAYLTF